jgi:hypothetical protein
VANKAEIAVIDACHHLARGWQAVTALGGLLSCRLLRLFVLPALAQRSVGLCP